MERSEAHDKRYRDAISLLKVERKRQGMTQERLASALGKRQQFVSKFESGERRLDVVEYVDIASALRMDIMECLETLQIPVEP